jgi:hypothetical protein
VFRVSAVSATLTIELNFKSLPLGDVQDEVMNRVRRSGNLLLGLQCRTTLPLTITKAGQFTEVSANLPDLQIFKNTCAFGRDTCISNAIARLVVAHTTTSSAVLRVG